MTAGRCNLEPPFEAVHLGFFHHYRKFSGDIKEQKRSAFILQESRGKLRACTQKSNIIWEKKS